MWLNQKRKDMSVLPIPNLIVSIGRSKKVFVSFLGFVDAPVMSILFYLYVVSFVFCYICILSIFNFVFCHVCIFAFRCICILFRFFCILFCLYFVLRNKLGLSWAKLRQSWDCELTEISLNRIKISLNKCPKL